MSHGHAALKARAAIINLIREREGSDREGVEGVGLERGIDDGGFERNILCRFCRILDFTVPPAVA